VYLAGKIKERAFLFHKKIKKQKMNLSKAEFLAEASNYYDELKSKTDSKTQTFYDYESEFVKIAQSFTRKMLEKSVGLKQEKEQKKNSNELRRN
jgi:hypothetical protein